MKQSTENTLWIARDSNKGLYLYDKKPFKRELNFYAENDSWVCWLDKNLYPEITFENSPKQLILSWIMKKFVESFKAAVATTIVLVCLYGFVIIFC